MAKIETLNFDNLVLRLLPIDTEEENYTRQVSGACFSRVQPTPVDHPETVAYSEQAMQLLDLPETECQRSDFAEYFSGNKAFPGSQPAAHCYCGHQFGHFAGQLGDGAAMYLGEVVNKAGERWEIQFKGAGLTPFSRAADGRKVLRSSIREFLCSEAIHHLGIPTTRAGSCVTSQSKVVRDIFYNGNRIQEKCTIVLRIAQTFIRFGSFEIFKAPDMETGRRGPSAGKTELLKQLLEYVIKVFYSQIWDEHQSDKQNMYLEFYKEVVRRTARLVAAWQAVGWCHGVLNTDNMSILGLTIDYGPYGFMDSFDPEFICNGSDDGGRYTYENQPDVCKWNCMKLGEALEPMISTDITRPVLEELYDTEYQKSYMENMRKKLGLVNKELDQDKQLIESLFKSMAETGADFTNTFRALSGIPLPGDPQFDEKVREVSKCILSQCCTLEELMKASAPRMDPRQLNMFMMLMQMNPELLAAMGGGQGAIMKELERIEKYKEIKKMKPEEKEVTDKETWTAWLAEYITRLKHEVEGVEDLASASEKRKVTMNQTNPKFILRNYIAQNAIEAAEKGDYTEVRRVLKLLENPYSEDVDLSNIASGSATETTVETDESDVGASCSFQSKIDYNSKPPLWAKDLRVT